MLIKAGQQQQSIDQKPKIIEEKLKTSTPTEKINGKIKEEEEEEEEAKKEQTLNKNQKKNNTTTITMSTNNLNTTVKNENQFKKQLNNSVSNSLSSLIHEKQKLLN